MLKFTHFEGLDILWKNVFILDSKTVYVFKLGKFVIDTNCFVAYPGIGHLVVACFVIGQLVVA